MNWLFWYIVDADVWLFCEIFNDFRGDVPAVYNSFLILFESLIEDEGKSDAAEDPKKDKYPIHT